MTQGANGDQQILLRAENVSKRFGGVQALSGVTLTIGEPGITGLIGPNGSGKSTFINVISGVMRASGGTVTWGGRDITGWSAPRIARTGIARTFQQNMAFGGISVMQNLEIALDATGRSLRDAITLVEEVDLATYKHMSARDLPFGVARRLGIALAMALRPRLLCLDEPAAGLNDQESVVLGELLVRIAEGGTRILLVDHDMSFLMPVCHRIIVLDSGEVLAQGTPEEIQRNRQVISVYLGSSFVTDQSG